MVKTIDILGHPHAYELSNPTSASMVLVFVHGWLLSHRYWNPVIQRLAPDYQCLAYDLRGFGASQPTRKLEASAPVTLQSQVLDKSPVAVAPSAAGAVAALGANLPTPVPITDYTAAAYAKDLHQLLQALNIQNVWLVGHSLGGSIALWAANLFPETVAGVICINSGGGIYLKEEFEQFRTVGQQLVKLRPRWLSYLPMLDLMLTRMNVARPIDRRWGRQRLLDLVSAQSEAALGTLLDTTTEAEVHLLPQIVSRLQQPVYFIAGAEDMVMEPKYVNHLASFHYLFEGCGSNVVEIPKCGHLAMVEQPDAVAQEIGSILARHSGESAAASG